MRSKEDKKEYNLQYRIRNQDELRRKKRELMKRNLEKYRPVREAYQKTTRFKYTSVLYRGKKLGGQVLTFEQFKQITKLPCYYCKRDGYVGIDRVDSHLGYTIENSVPCCTQCNISKNVYTQQSFIEMCHLVANNHPIYDEELDRQEAQNMV